VFTARYALSLYINQRNFVFKGLVMDIQEFVDSVMTAFEDAVWKNCGTGGMSGHIAGQVGCPGILPDRWDNVKLCWTHSVCGHCAGRMRYPDTLSGM